jgi:hypothetical protein
MPCKKAKRAVRKIAKAIKPRKGQSKRQAAKAVYYSKK